MIYAHKAAVIDRFVATEGLQGRVGSVTLDSLGGAHVHTLAAIPGVEYTSHERNGRIHHTAMIHREEMEIRLTYLTLTEVAA